MLRSMLLRATCAYHADSDAASEDEIGEEKRYARFRPRYAASMRATRRSGACRSPRLQFLQEDEHVEYEET